LNCVDFETAYYYSSLSITLLYTALRGYWFSGFCVGWRGKWGRGEGVLTKIPIRSGKDNTNNTIYDNPSINQEDVQEQCFQSDIWQ
jgi:hypothetical protein